jgi:hypothetical protein
MDNTVFYIQGRVDRVNNCNMEQYTEQFAKVVKADITGRLEHSLPAYYNKAQTDAILLVNNFFDNLCSECNTDFRHIREESEDFDEEYHNSDYAGSLGEDDGTIAAVDKFALAAYEDADPDEFRFLGRLFNIVVMFIVRTDDRRNWCWYMIRQEYNEETGINFTGKEQYIKVPAVYLFRTPEVYINAVFNDTDKHNIYDCTCQRMHKNANK